MELFDLFVCKWDNFKFIFWIKRDWGKKKIERKKLLELNYLNLYV